MYLHLCVLRRNRSEGARQVWGLRRHRSHDQRSLRNLLAPQNNHRKRRSFYPNFFDLISVIRSKEVWRQLGLIDVVKRRCTQFKSGEEVLHELLSMEETEVQILGLPKLKEVVATAAWYIWYEHRKKYHGEDTQKPSQIALAIRGLSANFTIACSTKAKLRVGSWEKPIQGHMKLNVDAGFDRDLLEGSVGAVIRDYNGKFIAAANERVDICYDSFTAEALAVRFGLNLARTIGCSKIVINSDNMEVVEALRAGNSSSAASAIIDDCYFMSSDFNHVIYDHCNRESNKVAHELARIVKFSPPSIWMDSAPDILLPLLVNDATILLSE